jgi:hypothetical protein
LPKDARHRAFTPTLLACARLANIATANKRAGVMPPRLRDHVQQSPNVAVAAAYNDTAFKFMFAALSGLCCAASIGSLLEPNANQSLTQLGQC